MRDTIKVIEDIPLSAKTIRKTCLPFQRDRQVWRQEGISSRKRRKKHVTKQNLREAKRQWALFQQIDEDTKDLIDIPEYWPQMRGKGLPKVQYTARDVTSGMMFLGFTDERSLTYATLFAEYLNCHLQRNGADLSKTVRQTDNGSGISVAGKLRTPVPIQRLWKAFPDRVTLPSFPALIGFKLMSKLSITL